MRLGKEQLSKISQLLITNQYAHPDIAALREILSNAFDANNEATQLDGKQRCVDVLFDMNKTVIRDYGAGLSEEDMNNLYTLIGFSSKEEDENLIGAFGIGRLAPLAVNNSFMITSYHKGVKTLYNCFLNEDHIPSLSKWDEEVCNDPSGLEVMLLWPSSEGIAGAAKRLTVLYFLTEGGRNTVNITLTDTSKKELEKIIKDWPPSKIEESLYISRQHPTEDFTVDVYLKSKIFGIHNTHTYIDLGGALYSTDNAVPRSHYVLSNSRSSETIQQWAANSASQVSTNASVYTMIIRVSPSRVKLNTSREKLVDSKTVDHLVKSAKQLLTEAYQEELDKVSPSLFELDGLDDKQAISKVLLQARRWRSPLVPLIDVIKGLNLNVTLPSGKHLKVIDPWDRDTSTRMSIGEIYDEDTKSYTIDKRDLTLFPYSVYLLYDPESQDSILTEVEKQKVEKFISMHCLKSGKYKKKLCAESRITLLTLCNISFNILHSNLEQLSLARIKKELGEDAVNRPVLVVTQEGFYKKIINYGPILNLLGEYKPEEPEKTQKSNRIPKEDANLSTLLRQLRYSSSLKTYDEDELQIRDMRAEEVTLDILKKKVIYFRDRSHDGDLRSQIIDYVFHHHYLRNKFLADYAPTTAYVTDNLLDKLCEAKADWRNARDLADQFCEDFIKEYGLIVPFMASRDCRSVLKILVEFMPDHLPKQTLILQEWDSTTIEVCKLATYIKNMRNSTHKDLRGHWNLYNNDEFYKSEDVNVLFGPKLAPYIQAILRLETTVRGDCARYPEILEAIKSKLDSAA
jgi:hypothetical protein